MNARRNTTYQAEVKAVEIVYQVKGLRQGTRRVTVTPAGAYACDCPSFVLYGGCDHAEAVQRQREAQGRK